MSLQVSRDIVVIPNTRLWVLLWTLGACKCLKCVMGAPKCVWAASSILSREKYQFGRGQMVKKQNQAVALPATKTHSLFNLLCENQFCLVPGFEDLKITAGLHFGYFLIWWNHLVVCSFHGFCDVDKWQSPTGKMKWKWQSSTRRFSQILALNQI